MHLKRFLITLGLALGLSAIVVGVSFGFSIAEDTVKAKNTTVQDVVEETLALRRNRMSEDTEVDFSNEKEINVLIIGLDSRKETKAPHCDAIHMFTLNVEDWSILVTSVPRGTYVPIPDDKIKWEDWSLQGWLPKEEVVEENLEGEENVDGQELNELVEEKIEEEEVVVVKDVEIVDDAEIVEDVEIVKDLDTEEDLENEEEVEPILTDHAKSRLAYIKNQSYVSNSCSLVSLDYGIEQIEKIIGKKADYVVTVGFSQVLGLMRQLDMPTTESLQFLRHRQGYAIGDPQRSHNQALFMKDLILNHGNKFKKDITIPLQRVLYSFVDTDMKFETTHALLKGLLDSEIQNEPDRIKLIMRPNYRTTDYHFDPENPTEHLDAFLAKVAPYLNERDFSNMSVEEIQEQLIDYIKERLEDDEPIDDLLEKQIWLQIENDVVRELVHFDLVVKQLKFIDDPENKLNVITDFVVQKETLLEKESAERGRKLLQEFLDEYSQYNPNAVVI